ncbi:uncharacterized protein LOC115730148 [Rhodamnia argentea]|uniref:Uncharacterized protein LOC115730148 n=1 Tax=Rhodamnia argentea TaxID=178133 RepID=A0ABM3H9K2_9MYRT|nr:uncharacterized protein LOC115730148 [Rhodamnia argentea]
MVKNPLDRARTFRDGPRRELRGRLILLNLRNYDELYERGQMVKRDMKESVAASGSRFAPVRYNRNFGKRPMVKNSCSSLRVKKNIGKLAYRSNWNCRLCGWKYRNGPCPSRTRACFKCGQLGHRAKQCGQQTDENAPGVVTSMVTLNDHATYALFDPGASHSFVSAQHADLAELELKLLDVILHVTTPLKDKVLVSLGCLNCKIVIGGSEEQIDLAILTMYDFDVIIGINWLGRQRAALDCSNRVIQLYSIDHPIFEFVGSRGGTSIPLMSSLELTKLLDEGCQVYPDAVVDSMIEESRLEDIAVVLDFPNIFPQELLGLRTEREIEFMIELAPGTEPTSKASYGMSLSELKELKVRMQELRDKGFIRPSASS